MLQYDHFLKILLHSMGPIAAITQLNTLSLSSIPLYLVGAECSQGEENVYSTWSVRVKQGADYKANVDLPPPKKMHRSILEAFLLVSTLGSIWTLPLEPHLTLAEEWNGYYRSDTKGQGSYTFGYDLEDAKSGNVQYRVEERYPNGTVKGSYGLVEPDGNIKVVKYVADKSGYRATVEDTKQKYPRHHPPLTSRTENEGDSEISIETPSFVQSFLPLSQSIQEIRTPPKYQDSWPDNLLSYNYLPNLEYT